MIDLKKKKYIRNNKVLIDNGIPVNGFEIRKEPVSIEELENLYHSYKNSIPTEDDMKSKPYFKAYTMDELPAETLFLGINRSIAREKLELTLLEGILNGSITWERLRGKGWFWQSQKDKDFVILKEWITI